MVSTLTFAVDIPEYLLNRKVESSIQSQDYDATVGHLSELLTHDVENGHYFHNLGQAHMKLEQVDEAIKYYNQACSINVCL